MTETTPVTASRGRILLATAVALGLALVTLFVAVLPAEYGIDPLGIGQKLGLTALADTEASTTTGTALEPMRIGANTAQRGPLANDTFMVELRPFEGMEYKYRLEEGGGLVYSWTATDAVAYDFHGEPDGAPRGYAESYDQGDGRSAEGVFVAPSPGIHGWFWENRGPARVTVTLTSSGFYSSSTEYRDGERRQRTFPNASEP